MMGHRRWLGGGMDVGGDGRLMLPPLGQERGQRCGLPVVILDLLKDYTGRLVVSI